MNAIAHLCGLVVGIGSSVAVKIVLGVMVPGYSLEVLWDINTWSVEKLFCGHGSLETVTQAEWDQFIHCQIPRCLISQCSVVNLEERSRQRGRWWACDKEFCAYCGQSSERDKEVIQLVTTFAEWNILPITYPLHLCHSMFSMPKSDHWPCPIGTYFLSGSWHQELAKYLCRLLGIQGDSSILRLALHFMTDSAECSSIF